MKDNVPAKIQNIPLSMENMQQNMNNFPLYASGQTFPVQNMGVIEYQSDEKKAQTTNFIPYQNEQMKSSDSSFITGIFT